PSCRPRSGSRCWTASARVRRRTESPRPSLAAVAGPPTMPPSDRRERMSQLDFVVAVPARYAASRLPGKPLRPLGGEPLVLHVARRALAAGAREVWLATDDQRVAEAVAHRSEERRVGEEA